MFPRICLAGATGFTGQLIASELMIRGIPFSILGRNLEKMRLWQQQTGHHGELLCANIQDEVEIIKVLNKTDLVVNCVGPFNLFSTELCAVVTKLGKDYFDITGEQSFVKYSHERNAEKAKQSGASIVHSMSFESCLADIMASHLVQDSDQVEEISSFYYFSATRPSPGTRLTMQTAHYFPTFAVRNHQIKEIPPLAWSRKASCSEIPEIKTAFFMPYPEVIFFKERYNPKVSGSFILSNEEKNSFPRSKIQGDQNDLNKIVERHSKRRVKPITKEECMGQKFSLYLRVLTRDGRVKIKCIKGADMYGVTAAIVAEGISYYMKINNPGGMYSPALFFGDYPLLDRLITTQGIQITEGSNLLEL